MSKMSARCKLEENQKKGSIKANTARKESIVVRENVTRKNAIKEKDTKENSRKESSAGEGENFLRDQRGMATIEASFLIPLVLIVVLSMFYSIFYQLDKDIAESVLSEEMVRVADVVKNSGKIQSGSYNLLDLNNRDIFYMLKREYPKLREEATANIRQNLEKRLLSSKIASLNLNVKNKESEGEIKVQMTPPFSFLQTIMGRTQSWTYKLKINHIEGAEEIRRIDSIERE